MAVLAGCFNITTVFSHAQTVVLCGSCSTVLCQPTGGKARLTEGEFFVGLLARLSLTRIVSRLLLPQEELKRDFVSPLLAPTIRHHISKTPASPSTAPSLDSSLSLLTSLHSTAIFSEPPCGTLLAGRTRAGWRRLRVGHEKQAELRGPGHLERGLGLLGHIRTRPEDALERHHSPRGTEPVGGRYWPVAVMALKLEARGRLVIHRPGSESWILTAGWGATF